MRNGRIAIVAAVTMWLGSSFVVADIDAAKNYVKEAAAQLDSNDLDTAASKLDLAEVELDGVDAAVKAPVDAQIKTIRGKIAGIKGSADKQKYERKLDRAMREAEGSIGNLATWAGAQNEVSEILNDEAAKAALGDEAIAAAAKKFATFKKLNTKKAGPQLQAEMENQVKNFEEAWAESKAKITEADASPNSKESEIDRTDRNLQRIKKDLEAKGLDDEPKASFAKRIDKVADEFTKIALADRVKEVVATLQRKAETYKDDWDGWENENKGPTWPEFKGQSGGVIESFNSPKSIVLISRFDELFAGLDDDADYKSVAGSADVKKVVDELKARRDKAYAKVLGYVKAVTDPALAAKVEDANPFSRLKDAVRLALGEKSVEGLALQDKLEKKIAGAEAATAGAEAAKTELVSTLRTKADEAWPTLKEGLEGATEFDLPNQVGKTVTFTSDNLMGYRFKPGDYYFATTLAGEPVAAKIDPALMTQIKATETAIGRSIGDDDSDGKWEVFAVVTNKKVKLQAKREVEATGTVDGSNVKITGEYAEPVDATIIEIIAAKCGPFAGAKGKGVLKVDGTLGK